MQQPSPKLVSEASSSVSLSTSMLFDFWSEMGSEDEEEVGSGALDAQLDNRPCDAPGATMYRAEDGYSSGEDSDSAVGLEDIFDAICTDDEDDEIEDGLSATVAHNAVPDQNDAGDWPWRGSQFAILSKPPSEPSAVASAIMVEHHLPPQLHKVAPETHQAYGAVVQKEEPAAMDEASCAPKEELPLEHKGANAMGLECQVAGEEATCAAREREVRDVEALVSAKEYHRPVQDPVGFRHDEQRIVSDVETPEQRSAEANGEAASMCQRAVFGASLHEAMETAERSQAEAGAGADAQRCKDPVLTRTTAPRRPAEGVSLLAPVEKRSLDPKPYAWQSSTAVSPGEPLVQQLSYEASTAEKTIGVTNPALPVTAAPSMTMPLLVEEEAVPVVSKPMAQDAASILQGGAENGAAAVSTPDHAAGRCPSQGNFEPLAGAACESAPSLGDPANLSTAPSASFAIPPPKGPEWVSVLVDPAAGMASLSVDPDFETRYRQKQDGILKARRDRARVLLEEQEDLRRVNAQLEAVWQEKMRTNQELEARLRMERENLFEEMSAQIRSARER